MGPLAAIAAARGDTTPISVAALNRVPTTRVVSVWPTPALFGSKMNPAPVKSTWIGICVKALPRSVPEIRTNVGLVAGISPPTGTTKAVSCGSR